MSVKVMIVDDHPLVRSGFRFVAEARPEIELVGEAGSAHEAIAMARSVRPDVIVMDIGLGSHSGIDATRTIRTARPETRVLFVTMHDDETTVLHALHSGGSGYVLKGADDDELIRAIQAVHAGEVILDRNVGQIVLQGVARIEPARERLPYLTERENEVLELSPPARPTGRSQHDSTCPARPSPTTSPTFSPRSTRSIAPRRSSLPAKPATARDETTTTMSR